MQKHSTVDEYINSFQEPKKSLLVEIRKKLKEWVPEAEEVFSFRLPAYKLNGILVYFGAFKDHIGFFPTGSGITKFENELKRYETSKGTLRLPIDKPLPFELLKKIVLFRVQENKEKKGF